MQRGTRFRFFKREPDRRRVTSSCCEACDCAASCCRSFCAGEA